jgi:outer membrane protein assembly factor BamA
MNFLRLVVLAALVLEGPLSGRRAQTEDRAAAPLQRLDPELSADLAGQPLSAIKIEGNDQISSEKILDLIKSRVAQTIDPKQVKDDVRTLVSQGWFFDVESRVERSPQGPALIFRLTERPLVKSITFTGNRRLSAEELECAAEEAGVKVGQACDVDANRRAAQIIVELYNGMGYPRAVAKLQSGESPDDREVEFEIEEGLLVRITKISFTGNRAFDESALRSRLNLSAVNSWNGGEYAHRSVNESVVALQRAYYDRGFLEAEVECREKFTTDGSQVELEFAIVEGPPRNIHRVSFVGNQSLSEVALRRGLRLRDNSRYNQQSVEADVETILAQYARAGHVFADVDASVRCYETDEYELIFKIQEEDQIPLRAAASHATTVRTPNGDQPDRVHSGAAEKPIQLGARDLVDLDKLTFQGVKTYDVADIRRDLKRDFETMRAARASEKRSACLETIQRQLHQAYLHGGFPDAKVTAKVQPSGLRIEIRVDEGPRYVCGPVEITGAGHVPVEALVRSLTEHPKPSWILWKPGRPAPFDAIRIDAIRERLQEKFAAVGYFAPRFDVEIRRNEKEHTASLHVNITGEGPGMVLGEVQIAGAQRDSVEDVLKYLDVHSGDPCDGELTDRIHRKLWDSGRYLAAKAVLDPIRAHSTSTGPRVAGLRIKLWESPHARPLREELSPAEQALLKLREWLENWSQGKVADELALTFSASAGDSGLSDAKISGQMNLAPNRGQTMACQVIGHGGERLVDVVFVVDERQLVLGNLLRNAKLEYPNSGEGYFWFDVSGDATSQVSREDEQPFRLKLALQFKNRQRNDLSAFKLNLHFSPVFMLSLLQESELHGKSAGTKIEDGICEVIDEDLKLRFEATTGRLIDAHLGRKDDPLLQFTVKTVTNVLPAEIARLNQLLAGAVPGSAQASPCKSLVEFGLDGWLDALRDDRLREQAESVRALRKLVARWSLPPFSDIINAWDGPMREPQHEFWLSARICDWSYSNLLNPDHGARKSLTGSVLLPIYRDLVPRSGWWWPAGRDAAIDWAEHGRLSAPQLTEMANSADIGPLGECLLALVAPLANEDLGETCGLAGLQRLSAKDFRRDYEPLLAQDSWLGKFVVSLAQAVRTLDAAELAALGRLLPASVPREGLVQSLRELKSDPRAPIEVVLPQALDRLWIDVLRAHISKHLRTTLGHAVASRLKRESEDADESNRQAVPVSGTQTAPAK